MANQSGGTGSSATVMSVVSELAGRKPRYKPKDRTFKAYADTARHYEHVQLKQIKKQLIQRDGLVCALCGKPIASYKECTIDHINPRANGGETTIDNCQLAHFRCNQEKGNAIIKT